MRPGRPWCARGCTNPGGRPPGLGARRLGGRQELPDLPWAYGNVVFAEGGRALQAGFEVLLGAAGYADAVGVVTPQPLNRGVRALPEHAQSALEHNLQTRQQHAIPLLFQRRPATLDWVVLAMVRR